ncbi:proline-rich protein 11 isoform X2 [Narcine bancroftii]|uniref:proline-rich protein 11 isoform X2 n=1 Tax=Narcine bancroftii TaxID=1343680 RepID=UPI0038320F50
MWFLMVSAVIDCPLGRYSPSGLLYLSMRDADCCGAMSKLNQCRRKWKLMRKWQGMKKGRSNNKRQQPAEQHTCKPKPTTCQTSEKDIIATNSSNSFLNESVPVGPFSLVNVKNLLNPLKTVVYSMYSWWLRNIKQGLELIKDTLYPSRIYQRELNALRQHVESLEIKLVQMQEIVNEQHQEPRTAKAAEVCCCRKRIDSLLPGPNKIPIWPVEPIVSHTLLKSQDEALPPPPPPPPLPPPSLFTEKPLQIQRKTRFEKLLQNREEVPRPPSITMNDLLQVKLKRTVDRIELTKMDLEKKDGPPFVTVKDLLNVKLRKTQNKVEQPKESIIPMDNPGKKRSPLVRISDLQSFNLMQKANQQLKTTKMMITPHRPLLHLQRRLKKVNIERSPGGTPLYKENKDTGTGLTPVMAQALKRKFEMAHPKTPPRCCSSPNTSFDEQNTS